MRAALHCISICAFKTVASAQWGIRAARLDTMKSMMDTRSGCSHTFILCTCTLQTLHETQPHHESYHAYMYQQARDLPGHAACQALVAGSARLAASRSSHLAQFKSLSYNNKRCDTVLLHTTRAVIRTDTRCVQV